ncbi:MAG: nitroreductase family deazaflavin-dependent oxidoreductase [Gammaproteobacteria bacterium]|nr:MAG: nitroreductase family deazaflavin-dependent oxidoreductase [Gammaproteobacteria bacterium]
MGSNLLGIDMVLMYTIGRKTGKVIATPVACYRLDDDGVWVHATNHGQDAPPAWWLNLQAQPEIDIRLGRQRYRVRAETCNDERYESLWAQMQAKQPRIAAYRQQTSRHIPLVLLRFLNRYE